MLCRRSAPGPRLSSGPFARRRRANNASKGKSPDKPGPVHGEPCAVIHLGEPLPTRSSDLTRELGSRRDTPAPRRGRPLFDLAPDGVYHAMTVTSHPVSSYLTLSPLPSRRAAVCFLWHWPWGYPRSLLTTIFPYGARTFLRPALIRAGDRVENSPFEAGGAYTKH